MRITSAKARVVLNSRGDPTIEIEINGYSESAPEGASKGKYEALYLEPTEAARLFNQDLADFVKTFDIQTLDDLRNFEEEIFSIGGIEKYGANTILALEYAILRAWSAYEGLPIFAFFNKNPKFNIKPLSNVVGGGAHANWRGPDIQEFLILPESDSFKLGVFINSLIHKKIKDILIIMDKGFLGSKNDEGAWVSSMNIEEILFVIDQAINEVKNEIGVDVKIGVDMAASQLYKDGKYVYQRDGKVFDRLGQIGYVDYLIRTHRLFYIEDPLHEEDFEGFAEINNKTDALITGDDLTVTNIERIKKAVEMKSIKAVIIKPNQAGTLIKTMEAVEYCKKHGIIPILSHRSEETESNILAHLAVGWEIPIVKFGIANGERTAKLNELIRLEEKFK